MDTHAIVVNYASSSYLDACLTSLLEAGVQSCVLVDNYSSDEERGAVAEIAARVGPTITFVASPENIGFGAGVNLGFTHVAGLPTDLVWIVNPDAVVSKDALDSLKSRFQQDLTDIVSPLILTGTEVSSRIWFGGGQIDTRQGTSHHHLLGQEIDDTSGLQSTGFVTGAAPIMRSQTFSDLNGFREDLFLYWEDADLSLRAREKGLRLNVDFDAVIWHEVGGSGDKGGKSEAYYYYMQRNRIVVMREQTSQFTLTSPGALKETVKLLLRPLKERSNKRKKAIASFRGLVAGLNKNMSRL